MKEILVLVLIATCSGLLLGLFRTITYVDPKVEAMRQFSDICAPQTEYSLVYEGNSSVRYAVTDGETVGILSVGMGGFKGEVQAYVFFRNDAIFLIREGENSETYLNKLHEAGYFEQFYVGSVDEYDGSTIDGVTGASRSSRAVKSAVEQAVAFYKEHFVGGEYHG